MHQGWIIRVGFLALSTAASAAFVEACSGSSGSDVTAPTVDEAGGSSGGMATPPPPPQTNPPPGSPPPPPPADAGSDANDAASDASSDAPIGCDASAWIPDNELGFLCPGSIPCSQTELCCNPTGGFASYCGADPTKPSSDRGATCAASAAGAGSSWPGGSTWECGDKSNCSAGEFCVLFSTAFALGADAGCLETATASSSGSKCVPGNYTLQAGDYHLCGTTDPCAAGACTPVSLASRLLAYCK